MWWDAPHEATEARGRKHRLGRLADHDDLNAPTGRAVDREEGRRHPQRAPGGFAPIAIGLGLTLIHLVGIPVTNLSVNPARSTGPAVFVGGWALAQLWLFWVAPIVGGALGGLVYRNVFEAEAETAG